MNVLGHAQLCWLYDIEVFMAPQWLLPLLDSW
jgi:hypothetical protein